MAQACPKFVANGINIMAQSQVGIGVAVGKNKLIIQLEHIFGRIKVQSSIRVHGQMRHRLVRKKTWFPFKFEKSANAQGPI